MQLALVLIKDVIILAIPYRVAVTTFPSIKGKKKKLITNHNMKYHESKIPASRKEVFQPHLPVRLPCYDLAPVTDFTLKRDMTPLFRYRRLPWLDGRCVQGPGTYSPRHG